MPVSIIVGLQSVASSTVLMGYSLRQLYLKHATLYCADNVHTHMLNCTNDGFVLASDGDDVSLVVCSSCSMVRLLTLLGFGYWYW